VKQSQSLYSEHGSELLRHGGREVFFFFNRQFDVCSARVGLVEKLRPERAGDTRFAEVEER
jgi:hypothetical protein